MSDAARDSERKTKPEMTYQLLARKLRELIPLSAQEIHRTDRIKSLIPAKDRRRVWRELRKAGFDFPSLRLSFSRFLISAIFVLIPVGLLALRFGEWCMPVSLAVLGIFGYWLTRPFAIEIPTGCETTYQAAYYVTRCTPETYQSGLWSPQEVAIKVRQVLAEASCVDFEDIKGDMTMEDLGLT